MRERKNRKPSPERYCRANCTVSEVSLVFGFLSAQLTPPEGAGICCGGLGKVFASWWLQRVYVGLTPTGLPGSCCLLAGVAQLVEHQLPKLDVAGSSPVARSNREKANEGLAPRGQPVVFCSSQSVVRLLGVSHQLIELGSHVNVIHWRWG